VSEVTKNLFVVLIVIGVIGAVGLLVVQKMAESESLGQLCYDNGTMIWMENKTIASACNWYSIGCGGIVPRCPEVNE
jgi:hypothetical protein